MKVSLPIKQARMPNYLIVETSQEKENISIDVGMLDKDDVEEYIASWSQAFREHVDKRRKNINGKIL